MRKCKICKQEKEFTEFSFSKTNGHYSWWCKPCAAAYARSVQAANKPPPVLEGMEALKAKGTSAVCKEILARKKNV